MQGIYTCAVGSHMMEQPVLRRGDSCDRSYEKEQGQKESGMKRARPQKGRVALT